MRIKPKGTYKAAIKARNLHKARRIVIKVGTSSLTNQSGAINKNAIRDITDTLARLKIRDHKQIILVTSGAIGAGIADLGFKQRPESLADLQMAAAVGQSKLMAYYDKYFSEKNCLCAQILLTHDDIKSKSRSKNIASLLDQLLVTGVIPIINENDAVSVDEIRVGDNDYLASLVASMAGADLLVFLTGSDGLLSDISKSESRIEYIKSINKKFLSMAKGKTGNLSTGGMYSKLKASEQANRNKIPCLIMNSRDIKMINLALSTSRMGTQISSYKPNS